MKAAPTRRAVLAASPLLALPGPSAGATTERIVALEWAIVAMMLSIGAVPVGMGETGPYRVWVGTPELPAGIVDVGIRNEPNLEALAALRPDLILLSPLSRSVAPVLGRIAPVREVVIYSDDRAPLRRCAAELRALAAELGRPEAAELVIGETDAAFDRLRALVAARADRPILVGNFMDARHIRMFGPGSLFDAALARLGLRNGWTRAGSPWGFDLVGVESLALHPDAHLAIVEPVPPDVRLDGSRESLWANLPAVRAGRVSRLPPAWPFGEFTAARRFAASLVRALDPAGADGGGG